MSKWIDVNDRLPEDDERYKDEDLITVLATLNNGEIALITRYVWFEDYGYEWCWKNFKEVVAWMPLPEPYKRGEC